MGNFTATCPVVTEGGALGSRKPAAQCQHSVRHGRWRAGAVDWAWKERLTAWHLEMAFRVIKTSCRQTIECGGGNNYRLAHDGHRKAMVAEGWVQPEWCK